MKTATNKIIALLAAGIALGATPDKAVNACSWAAENIKLTDGPEAGKFWNPDKTPEFQEIADLLATSSLSTQVWVRKSAQLGLTTFGVAWIGSLIDTSPDTMAVTLPTEIDVKNFNSETLQDTIEQSPSLSKKVKTNKSRSSEGSTSTLKKFPGGWLRLLGAHSASQLRRRTIKFLYNDEVDEYPLDLEKQGDPMKMLDARQIAFHKTGDYKKFCTSTPTIKGISRIDAGFENGDQRFRYVPCPHCRHFHTFDFWKLKYEKTWPHKAHYFCGECGGEITYQNQEWMRAAANGAHWRAHNEKGSYPSFHLDAMYSAFTTWDHMVAEWLTAEGSPEKLKTFYNLWLGQSFEVEGDAPDAEKLYNRRADYRPGVIPAGGLFLTLGADVQQNRIEIEVVAWGVGKTSYSVERGVLEGDTMQPHVWGLLAQVMAGEWRDAYGNKRKIEMACIDAGYRPQKVYEFCRARHNAIAIKGAHGHLSAVIGTPSKQDITASGAKRRRSVMLWPVGVWQLKAELYGLLNMEGPSESGGYPPGWCFFPNGDLYDMAFFQGLTSESLVDKIVRGTIHKVWVRNTKFRNEPLDCRVYAMAAAYKLGMGTFTADHWQNLVERFGGPPSRAQLDLLDDLTKPAPPKKVAAERPAGDLKTGRRVQGSGRSVN